MVRPKVDATGKIMLSNADSDTASPNEIDVNPENKNEVKKVERDRAHSDVISNVILPRKPGFR